MEQHPFIIGGEARTGSTTRPVTDPYTGASVAEVFQAGEQDLDDAVLSAQRGCGVMSQLSGYERSAILRAAAETIRAEKEKFATLIVREAGKPVTFARAEVDRAVTTFSVAAEEATRINGEVVPLDITPAAKGRQGIVTRFPVGIIAAITPFNFPLNLVAHKVAPAIAAGNAVLLKPAPQTPLTALLLGDVLLRSGMPKDALSVLPAPNEIAERLVTDERIAMVSFTGSAAVGWRIKSLAGKKKVTLELGGNAAVIVHKDADLSMAAARCTAGAFGYSGQVCIKVQRILVHTSLLDSFLQQMRKTVDNVVVGDPSDPATVVGPMISDREAQRVEQWVSEAVNEGAVVVAGGTRNGRFFSPTVLMNVRASMKVCAEEIFGPVVTIEPFNELSDAVATVNASRYGLQAGMFTNDHAAIQYAYRHLEVGGLIVNDYPTFRVDNMPYGGVKDSGFGREGVRYAIQEMTEPKLLVQ